MNLRRIKNWYQILTHVKNWNQITTDGKKWYLIVIDVSDNTVKNSKRMQNAADCGRGRYFISVRNKHVSYMKFDLCTYFHNVRGINTKYVTYWYLFVNVM